MLFRVEHCLQHTTTTLGTIVSEGIFSLLNLKSSIRARCSEHSYSIDTLQGNAIDLSANTHTQPSHLMTQCKADMRCDTILAVVLKLYIIVHVTRSDDPTASYRSVQSNAPNIERPIVDPGSQLLSQPCVLDGFDRLPQQCYSQHRACAV